MKESNTPINNLNLKELTVAVVFLTIVLGFLFRCLSILGEVGNYLAGAGTLGLFLVALFQIPNQLKKFRTQRHEDRVSDIAFELSEATVKFSNTLKALISRISFHHEKLPGESIKTGKFTRYTSLVDVYRYRVDQREKDIQRIFDNSWKASYLENKAELDTKFSELKKIYFDLSMEINMLSQVDDDWPKEEVTRAYNKFYETTSDAKVEVLKEEILNLLSKNL